MIDVSDTKTMKKEFKDFKQWVLRHHGRRGVNAMNDEEIMKIRIREYFEQVKGIALTVEQLNGLEAGNEIDRDDGTGK